MKAFFKNLIDGEKSVNRFKRPGGKQPRSWPKIGGEVDMKWHVEYENAIPKVRVTSLF